MEDYEEARKRYMKAAHAMQTGVLYVMEKNPTSTLPKHLRTGINCAMSDQGATASLLIEKGIITKEEYMTALANQMEKEALSYEKQLEEIFGIKITLG